MNNPRPARIIFAGGGTGGHLFPAIAIANRIQELLDKSSGSEILFVGTKRGIEFRMREKLGYPLHLINMRGIVRSLTLKNLLVPFVIVTALLKSFFLINRFKPDVVVGTGGYVSWPVLKIAGWKKIDTVLQEQNSFPGITTRQLAGKATCLYLGFSKAKDFLSTNSEIKVTGNPVRRNISNGNREEALKEFGLDSSKKTILILGGSQGATAINEAVLAGLEKINESDNFQLLWQTGKRAYKEVTAMAGRKVQDCTLFPFAHNMEQVYAAADLAVARAGALTLAELIECNIPSILIPYCFAAGDHQRKNAEDMTSLGLAEIIEEKNLVNKNLIEEAIEFLSSDRFEQMKKKLKEETENRKPAVDVIAEDIIKIIENRRKNEN